MKVEHLGKAPGSGSERAWGMSEGSREALSGQALSAADKLLYSTGP